MKIGIIYGTNRPNMATSKIVDWLKSALEQKGFNVEMGLNEEFVNFDCDVYIVGSSVYAFRVWKPFRQFIKENRSHLKGKPIAIFVVCGLEKLNKLYFRSIKKNLSLEPNTRASFKGYGDLDKKGDFELQQKTRVDEWVEILEKLFKEK